MTVAPLVLHLPGCVLSKKPCWTLRKRLLGGKFYFMSAHKAIVVAICIYALSGLYEFIWKDYRVDCYFAKSFGIVGMSVFLALHALFFPSEQREIMGFEESSHRLPRWYITFNNPVTTLRSCTYDYGSYIFRRNSPNNHISSLSFFPPARTFSHYFHRSCGMSRRSLCELRPLRALRLHARLGGFRVFNQRLKNQPVCNRQ